MKRNLSIRIDVMKQQMKFFCSDRWFYVLTSTILFVYIGFELVNVDTSISHCAEAFNMFDSRLFNHDLDVIESFKTLSPRIGSNLLYFILLKLGLSFTSSNYIIFVISCMVFGISISLFVEHEKCKFPLLAIILLSVIVGESRIGIYAGFGLFDSQAPTLCLATALSFLALLLVLVKKQYTPAFLLIALSSMIHIHEGIYGYLFVFFIAFFNEREKVFHNYSMYLPILVILGLTLPNLLTSQAVINSSDFYEIYVKWRTPHHLYIWDSGYSPHVLMILSYLAIYVYAWNKHSFDGQTQLYGLFIALFVVFLSMWFFTYELLESKFFIKLYLPKMAKYFSFIFSLIMMKNFIDDINKGKNYEVVYFLSTLFYVLFSYKSIGSGWGNNYNNWINCLMILAIMSFVPDHIKYKKAIWIILIMSNLYLVLKKGFCYNITNCIIWGLLVIAFIERSRLEKYAFVIILSLLLNTKINLIYFVKKPNEFVQNTIQQKSGQDLFEIAKFIEKKTSFDDVILCDAFNGSGAWIQYLSKRVVYADFGILPSSERGILIWNERCKKIRDIKNFDSLQLYNFMLKNKLNFVLLENSSMPLPHSCHFKLECSNKHYSFLKVLK